MASLAMQYEKADMFEKNRIKRATELMQMAPEELAATYEENVYDKNVILDYWSSFRDEGQKAVEGVAMRLAGMEGLGGIDGGLVIEPSSRLEELIRDGISINPLQGAEVFAAQLPTILKEAFKQWENIRLEGIVAPIAAAPSIITNTYEFPITLEGAITNKDIEDVLQKIDEAIKSSPNYIGDDKITDLILDKIEESANKQEKLTNALREKM